MSVAVWVLVHGLSMLFWVWVLRYGGARRLQGSVLSVPLVSFFALNWDVDAIKLMAWCALIVGPIYFAMGLVEPGLRWL